MRLRLTTQRENEMILMLKVHDYNQGQEKCPKILDTLKMVNKKQLRIEKDCYLVEGVNKVKIFCDMIYFEQKDNEEDFNEEEFLWGWVENTEENLELLKKVQLKK